MRVLHSESNHRPQGRPRGRRRAGGFTLIEMLLVLVILATLAAIVIPKFAGRSQQAKVTAAVTQINGFKLALNMFEADNGYYPRGNQGLNALVDPPSDAKEWKGPYLEKGVPLDPWGNAYIYEYPGKRNLNGFDLMSMGPDGRVGGDDDITNWDADRR
jgi:general secretion pathway protein G